MAELTASARPSILIPFPGATDDHQRKNAEALAKGGAATVTRELTADRLAARFCRSSETKRAASDERPRHGSPSRMLHRDRGQGVGVSRQHCSSVFRPGSGSCAEFAFLVRVRVRRFDVLSRASRTPNREPETGTTNSNHEANLEPEPGTGTARAVMLGRTRRIHFVGIGGIGMSGIAELLANLGYAVSGSDARRSEVTTRLQQSLGVMVFEGHKAGQVGDADVVVYSSAVRAGNRRSSRLASAESGDSQGRMLAELMRLRFSIAIAGSHGRRRRPR